LSFTGEKPKKSSLTMTFLFDIHIYAERQLGHSCNNSRLICLDREGTALSDAVFDIVDDYITASSDDFVLNLWTDVGSISHARL
jgi:hypothetical protein